VLHGAFAGVVYQAGSPELISAQTLPYLTLGHTGHSAKLNEFTVSAMGGSTDSGEMPGRETEKETSSL
jgi:hypothetical protein